MRPERDHCRKALVTYYLDFDGENRFVESRKGSLPKGIGDTTRAVITLSLFFIVPKGITAERHW